MNKNKNLNEYIKEELRLLFERLFRMSRKNGISFDEYREELEFDNYNVLKDEVWEFCDYIKFECFVEIYEEWIEEEKKLREE